MAGAASAASPFMVLAIGIPAFQAALPSPSESRMADSSDPRNRALVRSGEVTGAAILLAVGAAVSVIDHSTQALVLAAITAGLLIGVHEMLLARPGFNMSERID